MEAIVLVRPASAFLSCSKIHCNLPRPFDTLAATQDSLVTMSNANSRLSSCLASHLSKTLIKVLLRENLANRWAAYFMKL